MHHKIDQDGIRNKMVIDIFAVWVIIVGDFDICLIFLNDGS